MIADFLTFVFAFLKGELYSEDRIVLYSAFGHGADSATFNGIATANFRGYNGIEGEDGNDQ